MKYLSILLFISAAAFCTAQRTNSTQTVVELERRAIELEERAARELRMLRQSNNTNSTEVREIERLEERVAELAREVLRAIPTANDTRLEELESRLNTTEHELQTLLNTLSRNNTRNSTTVFKRQAFDPALLVERAVQLEFQVRTELEVLRRANRTQAELRELERLADEVARLAGDVVTHVANGSENALRQFEERLREAELALSAELQRLNRNTTTTGNSTLNATQLVTRALELESLARRAIDAVNRTEARVLERLVDEVARLAADVVRDSATASQQQLIRLEERLEEAERELSAELRALNITRTLRRKRLSNPYV